jgi:hypothetical protein
MKTGLFDDACPFSIRYHNALRLERSVRGRWQNGGKPR